MGHHTPSSWFGKDFAAKYHEIIASFQDIILTQHYGH